MVRSPEIRRRIAGWVHANLPWRIDGHCEEQATKQSNWIATARFAHLAMTNV
jgi:hypothetical protein